MEFSSKDMHLAVCHLHLKPPPRLGRKPIFTQVDTYQLRSRLGETRLQRLRSSTVVANVIVVE